MTREVVTKGPSRRVRRPGEKMRAQDSTSLTKWQVNRFRNAPAVRTLPPLLQLQSPLGREKQVFYLFCTCNNFAYDTQ